MTDPPAAGDTRVVERTFTAADVERFRALTGADAAARGDADAAARGDADAAARGDADAGRPVVPPLLVASPLTEIGGDRSVVARSMRFTFHAPVYAGETVVCEWRTEAVAERDGRYDLTVSAEWRRPDGEVVLSSHVEGVRWKDDGG